MIVTPGVTVDLHPYWVELQQRCENLRTQLRTALHTDPGADAFGRTANNLALQQFEVAFQRVNMKAADFSVANKAWIDCCQKDDLARSEYDPRFNRLLSKAAKEFWEYHQSLQDLAAAAAGLPQHPEMIRKEVKELGQFVETALTAQESPWTWPAADRRVKERKPKKLRKPVPPGKRLEFVAGRDWPRFEPNRLRKAVDRAEPAVERIKVKREPQKLRKPAPRSPADTTPREPERLLMRIRAAATRVTQTIKRVSTRKRVP